jgi:hypothetical protein
MAYGYWSYYITEPLSSIFIIFLYSKKAHIRLFIKKFWNCSDITNQIETAVHIYEEASAHSDLK